MRAQATRVIPPPVIAPHRIDKNHHLIAVAIGFLIGVCVTGLYVTY